MELLLHFPQNNNRFFALGNAPHLSEIMFTNGADRIIESNTSFSFSTPLKTLRLCSHCTIPDTRKAIRYNVNTYPICDSFGDQRGRSFASLQKSRRNHRCYV